MRNAFLIIILTLLAMSAVSYARDDSTGLSLLNAVEQAINVNYSLLSSQSNLRAAEQGVKAARAAYWPKLYLTGSYAHLSKVNEIIIDLPVGGQQTIPIASENPYASDLMLSWNVYTFGRRTASVGLASKVTELSELNYNLNRKRLFDAVARAYYAAVFTGEALELIRAEKQRVSQILKLVEDRYDQELTPEFDLLQMQLRLEQHNSKELEFDNNHYNARLNLSRLLMTTVDDLPSLQDDFDTQVLKISPDLDKTESYLNREEYHQALKGVEIAGYARQAAKSGYFPDIALFADYNLRNGYQPDLDKIESTFSFGVNFNWLIFSGFSRKAEISRQNYLAKASQYMASDLQLLLPYQMRNSILAFENSQSRIEVGKRSLKVAEKAMKIAQTRYNLGDITMIELLEAENQLSEAELGLVKLKYEHALAQIDLKAASSYYPELE